MSSVYRIQNPSGVQTSSDYGLVEDNCDEYFHAGFTWPIQNLYNNSIRLCQNLDGHPHKENDSQIYKPVKICQIPKCQWR